MKPYTVDNFWGTLRNDIWVLKEISNLPDGPPTQTSSTYDKETGITAYNVHFVLDICMDARREAVQTYRKQLAPIVFALAQKIYAEVFRLVLGESGITAGDKQIDVERKIDVLLKTSPTLLKISPIFKDQAEFEDWWKGRYRYRDFREARNQIMHNYSYFDGNTLKVDNNKGNSVLNWTADEVFIFAECVLSIAKHISMMWNDPSVSSTVEME